MRAVGADAADDRGQMNHDLGARLAEEPDHVRLVREVARGAARDDDVLAATVFKRGHDVAAEEPCAAGHQQATAGHGAELLLQVRAYLIQVLVEELPQSDRSPVLLHSLEIRSWG